MLGRLELGGTCFARYGQSSIFTSKTDQIMSRYRPIAPKPTTVTANPGGSNSSVDSQSEKRSSIRKGSAESGRPIRNRKRALDSTGTPSPRGQKRPRGCNNPNNLASERSPIGHTAAPKTVVNGSFGYPLDCRVEGTFAQKLNGPGLVIDTSGVILEKDSGFMERAAASAAPGVLSQREMNIRNTKSVEVGGHHQGLVTGMMSRGGGLSNSAKKRDCVANIQALLNNSNMQCGSGSGFFKTSGKGLMFPIVSSANDLQQEISCPIEGNEKTLVTLPLLPDTPSCKDSILAFSASKLTGDSDQKGNMHSLSSEEVQLRLFSREICQKEAGPSESTSQISSDKKSPESTEFGPVVELSYLKQMYSDSVDPVILLLDNESQDVLWFNSAYERMVKAAEERTSNDNPPIINPTPIACFSFNSEIEGIKISKATLWGIMKNFPTSQIIGASDQGFHENGGHNLMLDSSSPSAHLHQHMQRLRGEAISGISLSLQSLSPMKKGVIMPQPVRPVGSSVTIEYIKDTNLQIPPLCKSKDEIEEEIESEALPALLSDSKSRVRLANFAYKKMVGQPECSWLESTGCQSNKSEGSSNLSSPAGNRINGEVILNYQLPSSASAFSCCARIQWINNSGEKSSIRAPCDVVRIITSDCKDCVYAWKFQIVAAFRPNCEA
eukprot:Gb_02773 [translate_table: standard]